MNNEAYAAFLEDILPIFRDMHLTVHDTTIDEVERRVVMHVSSKALTVMGEYANEYIFSLWMTEDGKTVERVEEFADSKYSADYFGKLGELVAGMEAADNKGAGVGSLG
jgi:ketosteroid isomerase-like protein